MAKYVLLILIILFVIQMTRGIRSLRNRSESTKTFKEDMITCDYCGVNFPESERIVYKGRFFCCEEHKRTNHE